MMATVSQANASPSGATSTDTIVNPSGMITLLIPVLNDSNQPRTFQAHVEIPEDWVLLLPFEQVTVSPREHLVQAVVLRVSPTTRAGRHDLTATVIADQGSTHEIDYRVIVPERSQLDLQLDAPAVVIEGALRAEARISNHGNVPEAVKLHIEGVQAAPIPTLQLNPGEHASVIFEGLLPGEPGRMVARTITLRARSERGMIITQRREVEVLMSGTPVERSLQLRLSAQMDTVMSARLRVQLVGEGSLREEGDDTLSLFLDYAAPKRPSKFLVSYRRSEDQVRFGWGAFGVHTRLGTWEAWGAEFHREGVLPWDGVFRAKMVLTHEVAVGGRIDLHHPWLGRWGTAVHAWEEDTAFIHDLATPALGHPELGFVTLSGAYLASDTRDMELRASYVSPRPGVSLDLRTHQREQPGQSPSREAELRFHARNAGDEGQWEIALEADAQEQVAFKAATADPWALLEEPESMTGLTAGMNLRLEYQGPDSLRGTSVSMRYENADVVQPRTIATLSAAYEQRGETFVHWGQRASLRVVTSPSGVGGDSRSSNRVAWQTTARIEGSGQHAHAGLTVLTESLRPLLAQLQAGLRFGPRLQGSLGAQVGVGFAEDVPSTLDLDLELPIQDAWRVTAGLTARWNAPPSSVVVRHHAAGAYRQVLGGVMEPLRLESLIGYEREHAALHVRYGATLRAEDGRALKFRSRLTWPGNAEGFDVHAGLSWSQPITIPLPTIGRTGQLLVRIRTSDGAPVAGVILTVGDRAAHTNASGEALFEGMREGPHRVHLHTSSRNTVARLLPGLPREVVIQARERTELVLTQVAVGSIEGRVVVNSDDASIEGEVVTHSWQAFAEAQLAASSITLHLGNEHMGHEVEVDREGRFSLPHVTPGLWWLDVEVGTLPEGAVIEGLPLAVQVAEGQVTTVVLDVTHDTGLSMVREGGTLQLP